jgi:hypothetical protein
MRTVQQRFQLRVLYTMLFVSVVMQDFSVSATGSTVTRGNMAALRCVVPSFVRDFLSVTSWLQDQKFNIYPSSDGGNYDTNTATFRQINVSQVLETKYL